MRDKWTSSCRGSLFALPFNAPFCMFHSKHPGKKSHYLYVDACYVSLDHSTSLIPRDRENMSYAFNLHLRTYVQIDPPFPVSLLLVISERQLAQAQRHPSLNPTVRVSRILVPVPTSARLFCLHDLFIDLHPAQSKKIPS